MPLPRPKSTVAQAVVPVLGGLAFFALLGLVLWGIAAAVSGGGGRDRVGDDVFRPGSVDEVAEEVAAGGPLLFPGLIGDAGQRPIGVYHTGGDPAVGWSVYSIQAPGGAAGCVLELDRAAVELVDPCSGARFPPQGTGLEPVRWSIDEDGDLVIDLRAGDATPSST